MVSKYAFVYNMLQYWTRQINSSEHFQKQIKFEKQQVFLNYTT